MNFNQGMRRLAVLAGVLGAFAGEIHAYKELRNVPAERYQHRVFEDLASSDVVKQEQAKLRAGLNVATLPYWSDVNGERIKDIGWNRDYSVDYFAMEDGGILASEPSPSAWSYLLAVVFPALGYLILWGAIRAIGWVGDGF